MSAARDRGVGLEWVFGTLAVLMGLAAILELSASSPATRESRPAEGDTEPTAPASVALGPALLCLGAIATGGAFLEMSAQGWAVIFVESTFGSSATVSGFAITAFMLGLSGGRLLAHVSDTRMTEGGILRLCTIVAVPAFLLVASAATTVTALLGLLIAGMAIGPVEPSVYRQVATRHEPELRGRVLSRITAIAYVGYLSSPVVLGPIAQGAGWSALWATAAAIALATSALAVMLSRLDR